LTKIGPIEQALLARLEEQEARWLAHSGVGGDTGKEEDADLDWVGDGDEDGVRDNGGCREGSGEGSGGGGSSRNSGSSECNPLAVQSFGLILRTGSFCARV
jgi:hypothetical protein